MVEYSPQHLDRLFYALSDATRRAILLRLARGDANVGELAAPFEISLAAVSKHLKVLEQAEFVEKTRSGRSFRCRARPEAFNGVAVILEELGGFWRERLGALENFLDNETTKLGKTHGNRKGRG